MAVARDEPLVAVAETVDARDAVASGELRDDAADDVVQPRAQAAAGDDGGGGLGRIEEDLLARAGDLEAGAVAGSGREAVSTVLS